MDGKTGRVVPAGTPFGNCLHLSIIWLNLPLHLSIILLDLPLAMECCLHKRETGRKNTYFYLGALSSVSSWNLGI